MYISNLDMYISNLSTDIFNLKTDLFAACVHFRMQTFHLLTEVFPTFLSCIAAGKSKRDSVCQPNESAYSISPCTTKKISSGS